MTGPRQASVLVPGACGVCAASPVLLDLGDGELAARAMHPDAGERRCVFCGWPITGGEPVVQRSRLTGALCVECERMTASGVTGVVSVGPVDRCRLCGVAFAA